MSSCTRPPPRPRPADYGPWRAWRAGFGRLRDVIQIVVEDYNFAAPGEAVQAVLFGQDAVSVSWAQEDISYVVQALGVYTDTDIAWEELLVAWPAFCAHRAELLLVLTRMNRPAQWRRLAAPGDYERVREALAAPAHVAAWEAWAKMWLLLKCRALAQARGRVQLLPGSALEWLASRAPLWVPLAALHSLR